MALHPNRIAKVRRAKRCCGDSRGASSVIASTFSEHLLTASTNCAWLPPCIAVTTHANAAGPTHAPGGVATLRACSPQMLDSGFLAFQPSTKSSMSPGALSPPCRPGSPPGGPGEVTRLEKDRQELVRAHTSKPDPPLFEKLAQAQLPSVARGTSELESIELLGHHVLGHSEVRVCRNQQEIHGFLVLVVVLPSIRRRHIIRQHNSPAIPQAKPRELEPTHMSCATWTSIKAAGHFRQGGKQLTICPSSENVGGVLCCWARILPCQPLHVVLEFQKRSRMQDLRLSGCWNINAWEFALHTRSPLVLSLNQPIKVK